MNEITIPRIFDAHLHVRQGDMLHYVAPDSDAVCAYAIIMPNVQPAVKTPERLAEYRHEVKSHFHRCTPLFTFQLCSETTPDLVHQFRDAGAVAAKLYPDGVTTNSHGSGLTADVFRRPNQAMHENLLALEETGTVLCLHGEMPGESCLDAEEAFLPWVEYILDAHPNLLVVLEHITTAASANLIASGRYGKRLACTITLHHLLLTIDDVVGNSHHYCKPVAKTRGDLAALADLAFSDNPQVLFGSDSAPHPLERKNQVIYNPAPVCCAAGIYSAPVVPEAVIGFFDAAGKTSLLPAFLCRRACAFYRVAEPVENLTFLRQKWQVRIPSLNSKAIPFLAGREIDWEWTETRQFWKEKPKTEKKEF